MEATGRRNSLPPFLVSILGVGLLVVAVYHHVTEAITAGIFAGPLSALLLDGIPAFGIVYAGYHLREAELNVENRWTVAIWSWVGVVAFVAIIGIGILIRISEGRSVTEPVFQLLLAAEAGAIAGYVGGYQTARARESATRARRAQTVVGFVNSMLRHDLRNDLTSVSGYAELLEEDLDGEPHEFAATIGRKTTEALERIEDADAVVETLLGADGEDLKRVDLSSVVEGLADSTEETFEVSVETTLPESAPILANEGVHSVVDNLLENAAEHNDAEEPRVEVTVRETETMVTLAVADNGPGMPEATRRLLRDGGDGGIPTGGLGLTKALVESYGGDIRVLDGDGEGTTVEVDFPAAT